MDEIRLVDERKLDERKMQIEAREEAKSVQLIYGNISSAVIKSETDYLQSGELLQDIATHKKNIQAKEKKITVPLKTALKETRDLFKPWVELCDKTRAYITGVRSTYRNGQETKRREEENKLRDIANKEQARLTKKAEKKAEKARQSGDDEKAEEILDAVPIIPEPVLAEPNIPKQSGVSTRKIYKFRIINEAKVPRDWLIVDEKGLGAFARATHGSKKVEGVEFYSVDSEAVTGR